MAVYVLKRIAEHTQDQSAALKQPLMSHLKLDSRGDFADIRDVSPTVKQTEKHLCVLTVKVLYINWQYSCSSIGNGASV